MGNLKSTEARFEKQREKLLDLTKRNPRLNYRIKKKNIIEIDNRFQIDNIVNHLIKKERSFYIFPKAIDESPLELGFGPINNFTDKGILFPTESDEQIFREIRSAYKKNYLETNLNHEQYSPILRKIASKAENNIQSTGNNPLFLTLGYLVWQEQDDPTKRYAPLFLIPINLKPTWYQSANGTKIRLFEITYTGEEWGGNLTLSLFLKRPPYNLKLIDVNFNDDDISIERLLNIYAKELESWKSPGGSQWKVLNLSHIDLFSSGQDIMYQDLDLSKWTGNLLNDRHIKSVLPDLKEIPIYDGNQDEILSDFELEKKLDNAEIPHVLDADSSQLKSIELSRNLTDLVIQGPPGTGKSQTITNIIASAMQMGQKVLFVAEKMAALEVVKARMVEAGLGMFCLELHSNKVSIKSVHNQIRLRLKSNYRKKSSYEENWKERRALKEYIESIKKVVPGLQITFYDLVGKLIHLRQIVDQFTLNDIPSKSVNAANHIAVKNELENLSTLLAEGIEDYAAVWDGFYGNCQTENDVEKTAGIILNILSLLSDFEELYEKTHPSLIKEELKSNELFAFSGMDKILSLYNPGNIHLSTYKQLLESSPEQQKSMMKELARLLKTYGVYINVPTRTKTIFSYLQDQQDRNRLELLKKSLTQAIARFDEDLTVSDFESLLNDRRSEKDNLQHEKESLYRKKESLQIEKEEELKREKEELQRKKENLEREKEIELQREKERLQCKKESLEVDRQNLRQLVSELEAFQSQSKTRFRHYDTLAELNDLIIKIEESLQVIRATSDKVYNANLFAQKDICNECYNVHLKIEKLYDELCELYHLSDLESVEDIDELRRDLREISRSGLKWWPFGKIAKTKRIAQRFAKHSHQILSDFFINGLSKFQTHNSLKSQFENNVIYKSALDPFFKGADTNWEVVNHSLTQTSLIREKIESALITDNIDFAFTFLRDNYQVINSMLISIKDLICNLKKSDFLQYRANLKAQSASLDQEINELNELIQQDEPLITLQSNSLDQQIESLDTLIQNNEALETPQSIILDRDIESVNDSIQMIESLINNRFGPLDDDIQLINELIQQEDLLERFETGRISEILVLIDAIQELESLHNRLCREFELCGYISDNVVDFLYDNSEIISNTLKCFKDLNRHVSLCPNMASILYEAFQNNRYEELTNICNRLNEIKRKLRENYQALSEMQFKSVEKRKSIFSTFENHPVSELCKTYRTALHYKDILIKWSDYQRTINDLIKLCGNDFVRYVLENTNQRELWIHSADYILYNDCMEGLIKAKPNLAVFNRVKHDSIRKSFAETDSNQKLYWKSEIATQVCRNSVPLGINYGKVGDKTDKSLIDHELTKQKRLLPVRQLVARAGEALKELMPCWMMSPSSVAQFLPQELNQFDLLIIDEASQVRIQEALGSLARCKQIIIVGDSNQMPPSFNFQKSTIDEEHDDEDHDSADDLESILDLLSNVYQNTRLLWHYRSQHQNLIKYSSRHFYEDSLVIPPSVDRMGTNTGIKYHFCADAVYESSTNEIEANAVVKCLIHHISIEVEKGRNSKHLSLGVVAMNTKQQDLIEDIFNKTLETNKTFAKLYDRFSPDQPLFIRNLESVQGDERDVIIISFTYGRNQNGELRQQFGQINRNGGWRRLNVLFTRAKNLIHAVTSMHSTQIKIKSNSEATGVLTLKNYLTYLENNCIEEMNVAEVEATSDFERILIEIIEREGLKVDVNVGSTAFQANLAVYDPQVPTRYICSIECDNTNYQNNVFARERDNLKDQVLIQRNWNLYRVWSRDWYRNFEVEKKRLLKFLSNVHEEFRNSPHYRPIEDNFVPESKEQKVIIDKEEVKLVQIPTAKEEVIPLQSTPHSIEEQSLTIKVGNTVEFFNETLGETISVRISSSESNISLGIINNKTPLAKALLGRCIADVVLYRLPDGSMETLIIQSIE